MVLLAKQPVRAPAAQAVEIIFTRDCFARDADDGSTLEHRSAGEVRTVSGDIAFELAVMCGAALYMKTADDPSPNKAFTITESRKSSLQCEVRMRESAAAQKAQRDQDAAEEVRYARAVRRELISRHPAA